MEPPEQAKDWGIAVVRLGVGLTFFLHGWQKVFQSGFPGVTAAFGQMGAPLPEVTGLLVSVLELVGGAALMVGLFTRLISIPLAIDMAAAILIAVLPAKGNSAPLAFELELLLFMGAVAMIIGGPGVASIDRLVSSMRSRAGFAEGRS